VFELSFTDLLALQKNAKPYRFRAQHHQYGGAILQTKIRGRGMDFVETRNYQIGDDIRLMDWRVTARTNKPHVKVFEMERERPVMLVLHYAPTMFFGSRTCLKSVTAGRLAAMLAWTAKAHGDRVGGVLSSLVSQQLWLPHAHNQTLMYFLKSISDASCHYADKKWNDWQSESSANVLMNTLKDVSKNLKPGALVLIISDWYDQLSGLHPLLLKLRKEHDLIFYHILDELELGINAYGIFPIGNGNISQNLIMQNQNDLMKYNEFCDERLEKMQDFSRKLRVPYYHLTAANDLNLVVRQSLTRGLRG
jgi:uncharacterized protein (DUF58 family)